MYVERIFMTMNFTGKTSLGILFFLVLINADINQFYLNFTQRCQTLQCNSSIEICRINPKCNHSQDNERLKCVYCALKTKLSEPERNNVLDESSYDEYYEYDEDDIPDETELKEYLDEHAQPIRKFGICPKVVEAIGKCDMDKSSQPDCRFDTDCPGDLKCCEAACGRRVCNIPIQSSISLCPKTFECSRNCPLGYRTNANGCLICECQSCPSMDQCRKTCPSNYLKDLFGCDICECNEQCPPFSCAILCPPGIGFTQTKDGCPLCQCAIFKPQSIERTTSCQKDVHCPPGFRCLNDARNVPMCQAGIYLPSSVLLTGRA